MTSERQGKYSPQVVKMLIITLGCLSFIHPVQAFIKCGFAAGGVVCPQSSCCSQYGWCGMDAASCGLGCLHGWGRCGGVPVSNGSSSLLPITYPSAIPRGPFPSGKTAAIPVSLGAPCTAPRVRREWRELTEKDRLAFLGAIKCLKTTPSVLFGIGSPSIYDDFVYVHMVANDEAHRNAAFLPWHRRYLLVFEQYLSFKCGYNGPIPYWDWSVDSQAPEKALVWDSRYFGGNGRGAGRGGDKCVVDGVFAGQWSTFPTPKCLTREWRTGDLSSAQDGDMLGAQYSPVEINYILGRRNSFNEFRRALEDHAHNALHSAIGGDMFDPRTSTNDPIFFMHHYNIDRLWYIWQLQNPSKWYAYEGNVAPGTNDNLAKLSDRIRMFGLAPDLIVAQSMSTMAGGAFCYMYSNSVLGVVAPPPVVPAVTPPTTPPPPASAPASPPPASGSMTTSNTKRKRHHDPSHPMVMSMSNHTVPPLPDLNPGISPHPLDRTDPIKLRRHFPANESWLRNMCYTDEDMRRVRQAEADISAFVDRLNAQGYVSPAALAYTQYANELARNGTVDEAYRPISKVEAIKRHEVMGAFIALHLKARRQAEAAESASVNASPPH